MRRCTEREREINKRSQEWIHLTANHRCNEIKLEKNEARGSSHFFFIKTKQKLHCCRIAVGIVKLIRTELSSWI